MSNARKPLIIGVDTDTQVGFVEERGNLYVPAAPEVRRNIGELCQRFRYRIGSVDSHAYDAWEFVENGGPFPAHCIKGTQDWLKISETQSERARFIPMSDGGFVVGEHVQGEGNRQYGPDEFADEVLRKGVVAIFEKEVYSLFSNPNADPMIRRLVEKAGGVRQTLFAVFGYCTGGYCVDAAAEGLRERGFQTAIIEDATAPIGEEQGAAKTRDMAWQKGIALVSTSDLIRALR